MNASQHNERSVFLEAIEIASADQRAAFLDSACGDNQKLRAGVDALLRAHGNPQRLLDVGDAPMPTLEPVSERPGTPIGPYKLLEQIGEGGFGVVFMAEQQQPIRRKVALKVLKPGMDTRQVVARFEAERQALAIMDHPNIAKVFDGGATPSGRPYFVMELVKGMPITEFCDNNHLTTRERLELFIPICQAVQHAHQKGIIHRDLKPSNVLVTVHDTTPVPKVIDFGVAKALGQELTEKTLFTGFAQMIGTPLYMSPEQAGQSGLDVDTRSDIYSLGVLLYELLTGTTPFNKERFKQAAYDEIRRIIREEDPPKPSMRLSDLGRSSEQVGRFFKPSGKTEKTQRFEKPSYGGASASSLASISAQRQTEPTKLTKLVRGELDWIVMKALEKDRNRRYETANGFAADVQRYLADEPVQACPPSAVYRFGKFARRNKASLAVTGLALFFLVLLGSGVGWAVRDREAQRAAFEKQIARDQAARQAKLAEEVQLALQEAQTLGDRALALVDDNPYQWEATLAAALAASKRADALVDPARGALDPALLQRLAALQARLQADEQDRQFVARIDAIRQEASEVDLERNEFKFAEQSFAVKALFQTRGIEFGATSPDQAVAWMQTRPEPIHKHVIGAFDMWLAGPAAKTVGEKEWLTAVLQAADANAWRTQARRALLAGDAQALESLVREVQPARQPAAFLLVLAKRLPPESESFKLSLLRQIQSAHPGDFWANENYGLALSKANPPQRDAAVRFCTAAVALRPENPGAHLNLGNALKKTGDLDGALDASRKALELAPNYAAACDSLGNALLAKGELEAAIAAYLEAIQLNPKFAGPHNGLGNALRDKGDLDGAIAACREAIRLDPKFAVPHYCLGNALQDKGDLEGAITAYREAIRLDPKRAFPHHGLGNVLQDKGDPDGAIAAYRQAIELDPEYAAAHTGLGYALRDKGDLDGAVAACREAIRLDAKLAPPQNNLGNLLRDKGDLDGAIAAYREAIRLDPKAAFPHNGLGNALKDKGDLEGAIVAYRQAISLSPKFAMAHNNLGNALNDKGDVDGANSEYRLARGLDPKSVSAPGAPATTPQKIATAPTLTSPPADGMGEAEHPLTLAPGPAKAALNFSPYGTEIKLVPKATPGLPGVDHLEGRLKLGPHRAAGAGQLIVLARSTENKPYDMLFIDTDHDESVVNDVPLTTKPKMAREKLWSEFTATLKVNHALAGEPQTYEDYAVKLWVVVDKSEDRPEVIRLQRRGYLTGAVTLGGAAFEVVLSDSNNDAVFGLRDWWGFRLRSRTQLAELSRAVGDYAWASGRAWKLELVGTNGRVGKLVPFDPGITEEEDVARRDRLREDRLAVRAPKPLPFITDANAAIKAATADQQPYFLKFETDWCGPCKEMTAFVFTAKDVVAAADGLICAAVDGDKRTDLVEKHGVKGYPTGILFGPDGQEVARYSGYRSVKETAAFFQKIKK